MKKTTKTTKTTKSPKVTKNESVTIEKIDNGWLAVKSGIDSKGNYVSSKKFLDKDPLKSV